MPEALNVFFRSALLYSIVLLMMRLMGKREIGQLSLFDLVVAIMIAELAAIPMEDTTIPLHIGIIPIATLVGAEMLLSFVTLKSEKLRKTIEGTPSIIVEDGKILGKEIERLRYSVTDLVSQLREKDVSNIADVQYAILENNGELSVILKPTKRPLTPEDIGIRPPVTGLPLPLILDGQIQSENLKRAKKDLKWLESLVQKEGYEINDVLYAHIDSQQNTYICKKDIEREVP
ncbi:DUF421 domain-containing protein [Proteinivorax hydrogeniformans]|uniref:DUF421 domain-containing protein n=1 Tax=Proteinivorax hydrogeniformans TaxID=1826727 RepID=A0AAU8HQA0_9FIRM